MLGALLESAIDNHACTVGISVNVPRKFQSQSPSFAAGGRRCFMDRVSGSGEPPAFGL
jgi:hypothetical protein